MGGVRPLLLICINTAAGHSRQAMLRSGDHHHKPITHNSMGALTMSISAIVGSVLLIGALALFLLAGVALAAVDKHLDAKREH